MLFQYTYLLPGFDADFFGDKNAQVAEFIIPVNEAITGKQPVLFEALLASQHKFCFSIADNLKQYDKTFIREAIVQNFVRLLFLPNYLKIDGKHVFFVGPSEEEEAGTGSYKDQISYEFNKQGIAIMMVDMMSIESLPGGGEVEKCFSIVHPGLNHYLNNNSENSFETFTAAFTVPPCFGKRWIIPVSGRCDYMNRANLLRKFETWLKTAAPFTVELIEMYNAATMNNAALQSENELLKFKLENSAYYLQLIRQESLGHINEIGSLRHEIHRLTQQIISQPGGPDLIIDDPDYIMQLQAQILAEQNRANETLNWYKNEYEVLPTWYKRTGQLIRAFMGKRTFKSLFKK